MSRPTRARTAPSRRHGGVLALALALVLAIPAAAPAPASAESAASIRKQMEAIRDDLRDAGREFDRAYWQFDQAQARKSKIEKRLKRTRAELKQSRKLLGQRVDVMYRTQSGVDLIAVVLAAEDFSDLVTRIQFFQRIGNADAEAIAKVERLQARLNTEKASLQKELAQRRKAVNALHSQRDRLQQRLRSKQASYQRLQARYIAATGGSSRSYAPAGPNGMVFPVNGVHYYSDTWGASRSGGRRRHQGTDIMSPRGTPCVAVASGTVTARSGGLGGLTIWLRADNGWSFYYAHLNGYAVTSGRVSAGQVIGYVGSTGNAAGGAPHLHFEIHPGGGGAINPYPYLRAME